MRCAVSLWVVSSVFKAACWCNRYGVWFDSLPTVYTWLTDVSVAKQCNLVRQWFSVAQKVTEFRKCPFGCVRYLTNWHVRLLIWLSFFYPITWFKCIMPPKSTMVKPWLTMVKQYGLPYGWTIPVEPCLVDHDSTMVFSVGCAGPFPRPLTRLAVSHHHRLIIWCLSLCTRELDWWQKLTEYYSHCVCSLPYIHVRWLKFVRNVPVGLLVVKRSGCSFMYLLVV